MAIIELLCYIKKRNNVLLFIFILIINYLNVLINYNVLINK